MEKAVHQLEAPIAVVGLSALFPGSQEVAGFWADIVTGKNMITQVPPTHWLVDDYYDPSPGQEGKVYAKTGAFLQDVDFDPLTFGIPPKLLSSIDTVQLLALLGAQQLLDRLPSMQKQLLDRSKTSVILGVAAGTELISEMAAKIQYPIWVKVLREKGLPETQVQDICRSISSHYVPWDENTFPGLLANVVAGRIANRLNLGGTNCTVDAACASSLAAVAMAVQELRLGHTDLAITGGCDALNDIFMYMCFSQTHALSRSGDCRPFSDQADGTVLGEGLGLLGLRRLQDAERDQDPILAVIHGIGSASDGKAKSIYAPVASGQALAIKRAYERSPYNLKEVELIEAHGTGTAAGDVAEVEGLQLAFRDSGAKPQPYCALGSVKSQMGHTKSAAGAAGLIKAILSLHHKILPPTIKITKPNPTLNLEQSPLYLNTEARPWIHMPQSTRKAGVSAFGFGGSNFHITMEEYKGPHQADRFYSAPVSLVLLSADNQQALEERLRQLLQDLEQMTLTYLAKTSQLNFRAQQPLRLALLMKDAHVGRSLAQQCLQKINQAPSEAFSLAGQAYFQTTATMPKIALLFPGQGSQYVGMTKDLCLAFDAARSIWDQSLAWQAADAEPALHEVVFPKPVFDDQARQAQAETLKQPQWAQPALGAVALCYWTLLQQLGIKPAAVAGHSYGELPALFAAGAIPSSQMLLTISRKRGQLMHDASHSSGGMTAVAAGMSQVQDLLRRHNLDLTIANINSPRQVVLSGPLATLEALEKQLQAQGLVFKRLPVAAAFHSPKLETVVPAFEEVLKMQTLKSPSCPVMANSTAAPYPTQAAQVRSQLARQLSQPVLFEQQINALYEQHHVRLFLECGPGNVLTGLTRDCLAGKPHMAISLDGGRRVNGVTAFWDGLAQLAAAGVSLTFNPLWANIRVDQKLVKASKTSIKINGANVGKLYPPPGGTSALPLPNQEMQPSLTMAPASPAAMTQPESKSDPAYLAALEAMQQNLLSAQASFQETLKDSHLAFLKMSESMFSDFTGQPSSAPAAGPPAAPAEIAAAPPTSAKKVAAPESPRPAARPASSTVLTAPAQDMSKIILSVVAEKTGYPEEMLTLDQDLESGLGIDSIKRVEIVSALQAAIPALAQAQPETLAGMRTLGDILNYLNQHQQAAVPAAPAPSPQQDSRQVILSIVAEKTGYPEEMLTLDQDLESGLGIDSIKRVEIVSALQAAIPALAQAQPETLAGMRTLGDILNYLNQHQQAAVPAALVPSPQQDSRQVILSIVAEKTGYPEEMLTLDQDLESGLGIDSIKRVEIVSALQAAIPALAQAQPEMLAGMRSLGDIVAFLGAAPSAPTIPEPKVPFTQEQNVNNNKPVVLERYVVKARTATSSGLGLKGLAPGQQLWLIPDNHGIAEALAQRLRDSGLNVKISLSLPQEANAVIYLPGLNRLKGEDSVENARRILKEAFQVARQMAQANPALLVVAYDGRIDQDYGQAMVSGLGALVATAGWEWPETALKSMALHWQPGEIRTAAETLFQELINGASDQEVLLDNHLDRRLVEMKKKARSSRHQPLKSGDVVVVSGGARGVTAACLLALAKEVDIKIALLGRTALQTQWAELDGLNSEPELKQALLRRQKQDGRTLSVLELEKETKAVLANREIHQTLAALQALGREVDYFQVDIKNRQEVAHCLQTVRAKWGAVNVLIHGAGVLADKTIAAKSDDQFDQVVDTKVMGLLHLLDATREDNLSHLCCFSSIAGRLGNAGQVDYAIANRALNALCLQEKARRQGRCVVKAIGWGPWEGGMVTPALQAYFQQQGLGLIPLEAGSAAFVEELTEADPESVDVLIGVAMTAWQQGHRKNQAQAGWSLWLQAGQQPLMLDHVINHRPVVPMMLAVEWCARAAAGRYPEKVLTQVESLQVLKGLRPDHFNDQGTWLELSCRDVQHEAAVQMQFTLSDQAGRPAYVMTLHLEDRYPASAAPVPLSDLEPWPMTDVYGDLLFHGPAFHVIRELLGQGEKICSAALEPCQPLPGQASWLTPVALLDGGLQVGLLALHRLTGQLQLPLGLGRLVFYEPSHQWTACRCDLTIHQADQQQGTLSMAFVDAQGNLLAGMEQVRFYKYHPTEGKRS